MPLLNLDQRSPEWLEARRGKITASLAAACLGLDPHKSPQAAYREILGEQPKQNRHMAWGTEFEAEARHAYEVETGNVVLETGLWVHDAWPWLAASPDGLVGADGLVEIKCPSRMPTEIPEKHLIQMAIQLACTGREWCDYWCWSRSGTYLSRYSIRPDGEQGLEGLIDFWERYIATQQPPPRRKKVSA